LKCVVAAHVQLAALQNRDLELQTSPFSNHGSVEQSTACFSHKNVLQKQWQFGRCAEEVPTFFFNLGRHGRVPSKHAIKTWIKNFAETGSALKKKLTRWLRSARTSQNIEAVSISVLRSPRRSVLKLAAVVRLSREGVRRILHVDLKFHPYKLQIVQELKENDHQLRLEFLFVSFIVPPVYYRL
jgi:hypothetical protein